MERQFATFFIGNSRFGIDILMVREINRHLDITPTERSPECVRGLLNLRGQLVTVIDLGIRLGLGPQKIGPESRCLVLKTSADLASLQESGILDDDTANDVTGLLIDRVGDMITIDEKELEPPPANMTGVDSKYLSNVVKLEDDLMIALRVGEILQLGSAQKEVSASSGMHR
ncbi:MAG: chemotaxis protein CheW [Candidatus Eisenbacteria bacterium]|uniref:Chemotaxis protein CheW n=1 Tax=Eiseniibacteriota bacterium TaxID=2212470 RepID=A0A948RYW2_UNCEI|nr:chemotaxis protein CheW [Candidatus Eisenbacteria bacterium]MBU1949976.1 chemotaxis protein CheW [Candidatus Eisenbacteria bacterium]MBU2692114.1 chemotaxis protein CheW [Candidatus Eisenbacteria bacterium]